MGFGAAERSSDYPHLKVRNLLCRVTLKFPDGQYQDALMAARWCKGLGVDGESDDDRLANWLASQICEFGEARSKRLSVFYNPWDRGQQAKFASMVKSWLEPDLARSGLVVDSATFALGG